MSSQRFAAWVAETKESLVLAGDTAQQEDDRPEGHRNAGDWLFATILTKAVVYALLTIAIAIHEAAETKGK